jgi:asparagine synthase (glutamine-hydrolysing)
VAAVAATLAPGRVSAYSGVFPDHPAVDESALIDELREALSIPGITAEVHSGGLLASAVESVKTWEMPLLGWGDFWTLPLLRAAAAAGVRTTLGGDGGDELFGTRAYLLADRLRGGHPLQAVRLAHELPGAGAGPARRDVARMVANVAVTGALPYRLHGLLRRPFAGRDAPDWLLDGPRWWTHIAHGLTRGIEETGVFEHQRRRAASAGLEARHPLFDLDLVELALRQPPLATFDRYRNRPVLRACMAGLLPDAVRLRPGKAWFDAIIVDCLAGPDGAATRRLLTDPGAELRAYVDQRAVQRALFATDRSRREQPFKWMWQVWRLSTAECWLRAQADPHGEAPTEGLKASAARVALNHSTSGVANAGSYVFPP